MKNWCSPIRFSVTFVAALSLLLGRIACAQSLELHELLTETLEKRLSLGSAFYSFILVTEQVSKEGEVTNASMKTGFVAFDFDKKIVVQQEDTVRRKLELSSGEWSPATNTVLEFVSNDCKIRLQETLKPIVIPHLNGRFIAPELYLDIRAAGLGYEADLAGRWPAEKTLGNWLQTKWKTPLTKVEKGVMFFADRMHTVAIDVEKDGWVVINEVRAGKNTYSNSKSTLASYESLWYPKLVELIAPGRRYYALFNLHSWNIPVEFTTKEFLASLKEGKIPSGGPLDESRLSVHQSIYSISENVERNRTSAGRP